LASFFFIVLLVPWKPLQRNSLLIQRRPRSYFPSASPPLLPSRPTPKLPKLSFYRMHMRIGRCRITETRILWQLYEKLSYIYLYASNIIPEPVDSKPITLTTLSFHLTPDYLSFPTPLPTTCTSRLKKKCPLY
jgi:hypothetical protein